MTKPARRSIAFASVATLVLTVVACGGATAPSGAGSGSVSPIGSDGPSPVASARPSAAPTVPVATPAATLTLQPSTACAVTPQTGILPSDRFTDIRISSTAETDVLTFVFGEPSLEGPPAAPPKGSLEIATTPYTMAGSGEAVTIAGEHVLQFVFTGMSLSNDVGQETYIGPPSVEKPSPGLRDALVYDMSEGVVGWYVGYDGPGCVALSQSNGAVRLSIERQ
jgi:hypothetical protein